MFFVKGKCPSVHLPNAQPDGIHFLPPSFFDTVSQQHLADALSPDTFDQVDAFQLNSFFCGDARFAAAGDKLCVADGLAVKERDEERRIPIGDLLLYRLYIERFDDVIRKVVRIVLFEVSLVKGR